MSKKLDFNHRLVLLCLLGIAVMVLSLSVGSSWTSANDDSKVRRHTLKNNAAGRLSGLRGE